MNILSIETSCDETGISLVECSLKEDTYVFKVRSNNLLSQARLHAEYGGVFPSLAKREHAKAIVPLVEKTLLEAGLDRSEERNSKNLEKAREFLDREEETARELEKLAGFDVECIDAVAVTVGPGLAPALWVGVNTARALAALWEKPLIPVNHMHGHLFSSLFPRSEMFKTPALVLLVSGGHTELLELTSDLSIEMLGSTRDDAVGEAFDKAARLLELGYPGGALISKEAAKHREKFQSHESKLFPRPMATDDSLDVSYSGLKTALLYHLRDNPVSDEEELSYIAREFEDAALDCILIKVEKALREGGFSSLVVGGGVIANTELRKRLTSLSEANSVSLHIPEFELTTDNSLMIAVAGFVTKQNKKVDAVEDPKLMSADANLHSNMFVKRII